MFWWTIYVVSNPLDSGTAVLCRRDKGWESTLVGGTSNRHLPSSTRAVHARVGRVPFAGLRTCIWDKNDTALSLFHVGHEYQVDIVNEHVIGWTVSQSVRRQGWSTRGAGKQIAFQTVTKDTLMPYMGNDKSFLGVFLGWIVFIAHLLRAYSFSNMFFLRSRTIASRRASKTLHNCWL